MGQDLGKAPLELPAADSRGILAAVKAAEPTVYRNGCTFHRSKWTMSTRRSRTWSIDDLGQLHRASCDIRRQMDEPLSYVLSPPRTTTVYEYSRRRHNYKDIAALANKVQETDVLLLCAHKSSTLYTPCRSTSAWFRSLRIRRCLTVIRSGKGRRAYGDNENAARWIPQIAES
jgi:hypothetical protein